MHASIIHHPYFWMHAPIIDNFIVDVINISLIEEICLNIWNTFTIVPLPTIDKAAQCENCKLINVLVQLVEHVQ